MSTSRATHASRLQLPPGPWNTVLEGLCARFPQIPAETWLSRFGRGQVQDALGRPLAIDAPYRVGQEIGYYREVEAERPIPFVERVLHQDDHLVVVDKPHFLAVMPAGRFVRETLLSRLLERCGNPNLVPLHRIDRETAGLVLFSSNPLSRGAYQALFRERAIVKDYEAFAAPLPMQAFPLLRCSRIERGAPFFRMQEIPGSANSETQIEVLHRDASQWHYALRPVTGRKHQLRVHMAALGSAISNDCLYPHVSTTAQEDFSRPLQLLAKRLAFVDPLTGAQRVFESALRLAD